MNYSFISVITYQHVFIFSGCLYVYTPRHERRVITPLHLHTHLGQSRRAAYHSHRFQYSFRHIQSSPPKSSPGGFVLELFVACLIWHIIFCFQYIHSDTLNSITTTLSNPDADFDETPDEDPLERFEVLGLKKVQVYDCCAERGKL